MSEYERGLRAALKLVEIQRLDKPHHRYNHFEDLHPGQVVEEIAERVKKRIEMCRRNRRNARRG